MPTPSTAPGWRPSAARTLPLPGDARSPAWSWPDMAAGELLDYTLDCAAWVAATGELVGACGWSDRATNSVWVIEVAAIGHLAVAWIGAGMESIGRHMVTIRLETRRGQTVNTVEVRVPLRVMPHPDPSPGPPVSSPPVSPWPPDGSPLIIDVSPPCCWKG